MPMKTPEALTTVEVASALATKGSVKVKLSPVTSVGPPLLSDQRIATRFTTSSGPQERRLGSLCPESTHPWAGGSWKVGVMMI
jgi:hypothetical protein